MNPEQPGTMVAELERLHPQSFGWAVACCRGDRSEAEEVLQATYMKILDGSARFGARSQFKTWLFAVIRLTALEHRRRAFLRRLIEDRVRRDPIEVPTVPAIEEDPEKVEALRAVLGELSRRQREVINLVFYHDLSVAEAAEVMKVSVGSARRHYDRGKKRRVFGRIRGLSEWRNVVSRPSSRLKAYDATPVFSVLRSKSITNALRKGSR